MCIECGCSISEDKEHHNHLNEQEMTHEHLHHNPQLNDNNNHFGY